MERGLLEDLVAFSAVARLCSFKRAAEELGLSTSTLSYTIKRLESRLGVRLLQRNSRSVAATVAGERLMATLTPALVNIAGVVGELRRERGSVAGVVRITAARQAFEAVIRPVLSAFSVRYPDAVIEVMIDYKFRDIIRDRFDAGIRIGEKLEQDMIAIPVGPALRMAVVASPSYLHEHPKANVPDDLVTHRCIGYRMRYNGAIVPWVFKSNGREADGATGDRRSWSGLRSRSPVAVRRAACAAGVR